MNAIPEYGECKYYPCYCDQCKATTDPGEEFCEKHIDIMCVSCGAKATSECDYTGQLVCGAPLCDDCHGYSEPGPSGAWGMQNHRHKRKDAPTNAEQEKLDRSESDLAETIGALTGSQT